MYRPFLRPIAISNIATSDRITSEKVALVLPLERSLNVIGNDCILQLLTMHIAIDSLKQMKPLFLSPTASLKSL